jgi:hypothetical protein
MPRTKLHYTNKLYNTNERATNEQAVQQIRWWCCMGYGVRLHFSNDTHKSQNTFRIACRSQIQTMCLQYNGQTTARDLPTDTPTVDSDCEAGNYRSS